MALASRPTVTHSPQEPTSRSSPLPCAFSPVHLPPALNLTDASCSSLLSCSSSPPCNASVSFCYHCSRRRCLRQCHMTG
ncbi:hypothetical protein OE88DRAFT_1525776 [Heliocybe sulcata]|uniref:Uncharacterized protein n=1 Tax=Heliocybe sulcata TaxID=5364 RepID=A0A5C3N4B5_9AGAM|nr:hypothetical protein OE88DRAFT_1525776 [Heliocybe sulcata]